MQAEDIISLFETLVDDSTELSTQEELDLLNRKYHEVLDSRPWFFLIKPFTGTVASSVVSLPSDFGMIVPIYDQDTGQNISLSIGSSNQPYELININDRIGAQNNTAYVDFVNNDLVFASQPSDSTVNFNYVYVPSDLALNQSPVFPKRFHPMLAYLMAEEDFDIQLFDKAKSYSNENEAKAAKYLKNMVYWNSQFINI